MKNLIRTMNGNNADAELDATIRELDEEDEKHEDDDDFFAGLADND